MTREQAAEYIGVSPSTLADWAHTGRRELPYYQLGRKVFYMKSDLDEFIESLRQTKASAAASPE